MPTPNSEVVACLAVAADLVAGVELINDGDYIGLLVDVGVRRAVEGSLLEQFQQPLLEGTDV